MSAKPINPGIEDELFGVLLGLWAGFLSVDSSQQGDRMIGISMPFYFLLYFACLLAFVVALIKVAFYQEGFDRRWLYYIIALGSCAFGLTGLWWFNWSLHPAVVYFGLVIVALWVVIAELTTYAILRD